VGITALEDTAVEFPVITHRVQCGAVVIQAREVDFKIG
jgi:hypothetical protein